MNRVQVVDEMRGKLRMMHRALKTERSYIDWVQKYISFLAGLSSILSSEEKFELYMTHLAVKCRVAASTQNQAFNAILFMYRHVLKVDIKNVEGKRARRDKYIPTVMTRDEVAAVIGKMQGTNKLIASLIYGCGLRVKEALRLRVKDIDFGQMSITLRNTKGHADRVVMLPESLSRDYRNRSKKQGGFTRRISTQDTAPFQCLTLWQRSTPVILIPLLGSSFFRVLMSPLVRALERCGATTYFPRRYRGPSVMPFNGLE